MARQPKGTHATPLAFVITIVIVVSAVALIQLQQPPESHQPLVGGSTTGPALLLTDNATTLEVGQALQINVSLFNGQNTVVSFASGSDWQFEGVDVALWPPCYFDMPVQAIVLKGNYSLAGLQSASSSSISSYECMEGVRVDHAIFQPDGTRANITGLYNVFANNETLGPYDLSTVFITYGSWNLTANSIQLSGPILGNLNPPETPATTPFSPGVYTVAVADEWGQYAILYVTVKGG